MNWKDKYDRDIKDGQTLLGTYEDSVEPSGFMKCVNKVRLCFWCDNENRFIPFKEQYVNGKIDNLEIIK